MNPDAGIDVHRADIDVQTALQMADKCHNTKES